ncbi:MAG: amino acid permease [Planctomycetes bacterium]|nr:amino acid permease [Planctomycetota bacterium]
MGAKQPNEPSGLKAGLLRVRDIWALGVGIVVCGQYFGWNLGLKDNGPVAMLIASLAVCLLFLAWVLTLSEMAVAMPRAGGPLDYGRCAGGPWLGFLMGWSMFLECLFGGVATALAGGKYVAFLLNPSAPDKYVAVAVGLTIVAVFFLLQARGVKEQARALVWMTYAALVGLVIFWIAALTNFSWGRVWTAPALPAEKGWGAVFDALPFALWWLIIIEAAALAAEESHEPASTIPRGLTWAVLTVIVLVVLTTVTATGAVPFQQIAETGTGEATKPVDYPLAEVIRLIPAGASAALFYGFGAIALFGLIASYHGLLYGSSRQLFALGRAGFVSPALGAVSATRQTPVPALLACSLLTAGFVVANLWFDPVIASAVLVAGAAALVLYLLSTWALFRLRRRVPALLTGYRAPLGWWLPLGVAVLSVVALTVYYRIDPTGVVVPVALGTYALGIGYFALRGRKRVTETHDESAPVTPTTEAATTRSRWLHRIAVAAVILALGGMGAVTLAAFGGPSLLGSPDDVSAAVVLGVVSAAIVAVAAVELWQTRRRHP